MLLELLEAAHRTDDRALIAKVLEWVAARSAVTPTEWVLGVEALARALAAGDPTAEAFFVEAIERLGRTSVGVHLARTRLLYGQWLRRQRR